MNFFVASKCLETEIVQEQTYIVANADENLKLSGTPRASSKQKNV